MLVLSPQNGVFRDNPPSAYLRGRSLTVLTSGQLPLELLEDVGALLERATLLKDSRTTKAGLATLPDGRRVFVKRYNIKTAVYAFKYFFRPARPFKAWRAAYLLRQALATPEPYAAVSERHHGALRSAYLLTEAVEDVAPPPEFFAAAEPAALVAALCATLAKAHGLGVTHGDCKLSNFYFPDWAKGGFACGLWDFDGAAIRPTQTLPAREAELARALASLAAETIKAGQTPDLPALADLFVEQYGRSSGLWPRRGALLAMAGGHLERNRKKR